MEEKDKPRVVITGAANFAQMAAAVLAAGLSDHIRFEPLILTSDHKTEADFVVLKRDDPENARVAEIFGDQMPFDEIDFKKVAHFETATERYKRLLREQAEREQPIIDAAAEKQKRKAEKRARDAARMEKKHV